MNPATDKRNTFARKNRITKPSEIYSIYKVGKKIENPWLSLTILTADKQQAQQVSGMPKLLKTNRLGIMIKRKTFRKAVERNRFKRIARDTFRSCNPTIKCPSDIVICVEHAPPSCDKGYLRSEPDTLFKKGRLC
jgi:ribonuclease P protein component